MYLWNKRSPSLAGFRPNQAIDTVYAGYTTPSPSAQQFRPISGLGAFGDSSDPTTWLGVAAAAGLAWFLFIRKGSTGSASKKRIARLAATRALATRDLKEA